MERELRPTSREERLALLGQARRCPGIPHHWEPPGPMHRLRRVPRAVRREVLARDGHRCLCCGEARRLKVTHVHPRGDGGPDAASNLQTLCRACAALKGSRCLDLRGAVIRAEVPLIAQAPGQARAAA